MKIKSKIPNIPQEFISLFLSIADLCDGVPYKDMKKIIYADYEKIMKTKLGQKIYGNAIEANNEINLWQIK